ncbi:hypothetical protein GCM10010191_87810 [Actinomadura vinacea]|uniref:Alpha-L-rhamnosidase C-terminal domain-containing protein n=1 Tax=Actinomadura vinacea TaxID=115336 RepID=A0ABP5XJH2_9ACTN
MTGQSHEALAPYGLRCEHLAEPLGLDERTPLLSWRLASARRGEWLYQGVAGPAQAPGSTGYRELLIRPRPGGLAWARAAYESVRGTLRTAWTRADGELRLEVGVPPGATATVHVPTGDPEGVRESGIPVAGAAGVTVPGTGPGTLLCRVASGDYRFTAADPSGTVP